MTDQTEPNAEQVAFWNDSAGETWAGMHAELDRQIEPLGLLAIEALAPQAGERVIDIGCGCGQTTLQLADRVGTGGEVTGLDISRPMLDIARGRAKAAGATQVRFEQADAQVYAFAPGGTDAAFSRFGVMFFADPAAAFANVRTGLRRGGRVAFVCWRPMAENPWMLVPLQAALAHLPPPEPVDPLAPGPFAFADPDRVRGILGQAGFGDIAITPRDAMIGGGDLEETVSLAMRVGPLGRLRQDHRGEREAVAESVRRALAPHMTPDGVRLGSAVWIVTAANP